MSSTPPLVPSAVAAELAETGCLPSAALGDWLAGDGLDVTTALAALLPSAAERAQPPVSNYRVGAIALGMPPAGGGPGNLYLGANLEFDGLPLGMSVHAEQAAVNHAWLAGETGLQAIAVTSAPCGHCRQFLWELSTADDLLVHVLPPGPRRRSGRATSLRKLLPRPFGPLDLGLAGGLMSAVTQRLARQGDELSQAAIAAAAHSYAPYTGNFAGVALRMSDGRTIVGRNAENAAYNPSLPPLQSALSAIVTGPQRTGTAAIHRAVLAEIPARASQRESTALLLRAVAPQVRLEYCAVTSD